MTPSPATNQNRLVSGARAIRQLFVLFYVAGRQGGCRLVTRMAVDDRPASKGGDLSRQPLARPQSSTSDSSEALPPTAVVLVEVVRSLVKRSR